MEADARVLPTQCAKNLCTFRWEDVNYFPKGNNHPGKRRGHSYNRVFASFVFS